jgi:hypothetical protein
MVVPSAHPLPLPSTSRPHPILTALTDATRLVLAAPLALVAAALLLVGLAFALATIGLHPYLGRLLWGPLDRDGAGRRRDRCEHGSGRS